ncbi:MAG TPA: peptidyl-prolyl cis-trans isomerase [Arcobacter sp.]|nr:peptidyl-prolyl cis-trans isomerase [Arcobacter sp.]HIP56445.1 peptidyl-prolyl cis-trans isomerase [Arcobacter sp.]
MKKYIIIFMLSALSLQAGLINAIAFTVNNVPVTLYDIDEKMQERKISKEKAVSILIDEALYQESLDKYNVVIDTFDIDNYIEKIAQSNNMSMHQFVNAVKQQQDYTLFTNDVKKRLKHQKLVSSIASNKIIRANDEDLEIYYNNNKDLFSIANKIDVIQYTSKNKKALIATKNNPMMMNSDVLVNNITLTQDTMDAQLKYIINQTKEQSFTAIFAANKTYNMLFVSKKDDVQKIQYKDVKAKIFNVVMEQREKEYLKNYFETLKITADIKVLR